MQPPKGLLRASEGLQTSALTDLYRGGSVCPLGVGGAWAPSQGTPPVLTGGANPIQPHLFFPFSFRVFPLKLIPK